MPTVGSSAQGPMSSLTWSAACGRIAGAASGARQPDTLAAARDALMETLQDWDSRHDWRFTQVVADDITVTASTDTFELPTNYKKPYVAYLVSNKVPLWFIERGNWHRAFPGQTDRQIPRYYTLYNDNETGLGELYPLCGVGDTLKVLYYRSMTYSDSDDAVLDIPKRWEGYILHGAKGLLTLGKVAGNKAERYMQLYEAGIARAKQDDRRLPDQFLAFQPPDQMTSTRWLRENTTWEADMGY